MATTTKLSCFVITGFGEKTDLATGRVLNLDIVYKKILKPVCDSFKTDTFEIDCFRACDKLYTGTIDAFMYKWILEADIAIADLSTLNPNAVYELGVRYALKPFSTIVISEKGLKFPFDFSHVLIQQYTHGGNDIEDAEVARFSKTLTELIEWILEKQKAEGDKCNDSPVYDYLKADLFPPKRKKKRAGKSEVAGWDKTVSNVLQAADTDEVISRNLLNKISQSEIVDIITDDEGHVMSETEIKENTVLRKMYDAAYSTIGLGNRNVVEYGPYEDIFSKIPRVSFLGTSYLIKDLNEKIIKEKKAGTDDNDMKDIPAIATLLEKIKTNLEDEKMCLSELLDKAEEKKDANQFKEALAYYAIALQRDPSSRFIIQRIVLMTYKLTEPDELTALKLAENLLHNHLHPDEQIDVETLGLAGAIYKRLAKLENEKENIRKALRYYEKGYVICENYYNGINCAFMYLLNATRSTEHLDIMTNYGNAQKIWKRVIEICQDELSKIDHSPANRDYIWILQSEAQARLALNGGVPDAELNDLFDRIAKVDNAFAANTFLKQNEELVEMIREVQKKIPG